MKVQALRIVISSARKFVNMGALTRLWNLVKNFHAADISSLMDHLVFREKLILFNVLFEKDKEKASDVLSEINPEDAAQILKELPIEQISEILQMTPSDDVASIVDLLPEDMKEAILAAMEEKPSEDVKELLHYEEETAGRIMSPNFYAAMQLEGDVESAFYLYIVDDQNHLMGVVSLRQVLFARPNTRLEEIMTRDIISVHPETDQEVVARNVADYNFVAIPVVDSENLLLGVVTVDDVIDVIDKEATEDIYKMVSLDTTDRIQDSPFKSIKKRLPFLIFSLITASVAPWFVHYFEDTIKAFVTLAVFMPLVMALGGIAGNQTIALIVREISIGQADWISTRKALLKEIIVNPYLGLILGLAIIANLFIAALLGTLIPLFLKLLRLDPALGSVNLLTMCTDTAGILAFLGLGTLFLSKLA